jgi:hypothetical protein
MLLYVVLLLSAFVPAKMYFSECGQEVNADLAAGATHSSHTMNCDHYSEVSIAKLLSIVYIIASLTCNGR